MAVSDIKTNELQVNSIKSNEVAVISIEDILRYETAPSFQNGLDIPTVDFVMAQAGAYPAGYEEISFTGSTGVETIDFNTGTRLTDYGTNPTVQIYAQDGTVKTFESGFSASFDTSTNILTIDGIFGDKTVVIKR